MCRDILRAIMLRTLLALALGGAVLVSALAVVRRLRSVPVPAALPLAVGLMVVYEGLALPAISLADAVTAVGIVLAQVPLIVAGAVLAPADLRAVGVLVRRAWRARSGRAWVVALAPLVALVIASAVLYPPNSWDAMTYHLARVAHWLDNRSVAAYPTWIERQTVFGPGAAYLVLLVQGVSENERLAALVQLGSWLVVGVASAAWARRFGAPRRLAPVAAVLVMSLPMAVLQASSTLYDLVATVLALAVAEACLPFLHGRPTWRAGVLLGTALAGAWLVKSTALITAAPLAAVAAAAMVRRAPLRRILAAATGVVVVPLLIVWIELVRRAGDSGGELPLYMYPLTGEWLDRLANSARALAHHLPVSGWFSAMAPVLAPAQGLGVGNGAVPFRPDESSVGNPAQAALFLVAAATAVLAGRRLSPRVRLGVIWPLAGWFLLHALARDNQWISRLEMPLFVVGTVGAVATLGSLAQIRLQSSGRAVPITAAIVGAVSLAYAVSVAARNELRPPTLSPPPEGAARYAAFPPARPLDEATLRVARARGCDRIGARLEATTRFIDPWDYPLTWGARQAGIRVQHVSGVEPWPCVLHTLTAPPFVPGKPWMWSGLERTFVR